MTQTRTDFRRYSAQKRALEAHPSRAGMFSIKTPAPVLGRFAGLGQSLEDSGIDLTPIDPLPRPWQTDGCKEFIAEKVNGQCQVAPLAPASDIVPQDPAKREILRRVLSNPVDFGVGNIGNPINKRVAANFKFFNSLSDADLEKQFKMYMRNVMRLKGIAEDHERTWEVGALTGAQGLANWAAEQIRLTRELARMYAANALLARRVQLLREGRDFSTAPSGFKGMGLVPLFLWMGFSTGMANVLAWTSVAVIVGGTGMIVAEKYRESTDPVLITAEKLEDARERKRDCVEETKKFILKHNPQATDQQAFLDAEKKCGEEFQQQLDWTTQYEGTLARESALSGLWDIAVLAGTLMVGYAAMPLIKEMLAGAAADRKRRRTVKDEAIA